MNRKTKKEWFDIIVRDIEKIGLIYAEPRIKGYVREMHERIINECIDTYLKDDEALKELAKDYFSQIKEDGERKRIKKIEGNLHSLENVLRKENVSLKSKEKMLSYQEERIKSQIPENMLGVYLSILDYYKGEIKK